MLKIETTTRNIGNEWTKTASTSAAACTAVSATATSRGPTRSASRPTGMLNGKLARPAMENPSPTWVADRPTDSTK
jgi:hypothetical protein